MNHRESSDEVCNWAPSNAQEAHEDLPELTSEDKLLLILGTSPGGWASLATACLEVVADQSSLLGEVQFSELVQQDQQQFGSGLPRVESPLLLAWNPLIPSMETMKKAGRCALVTGPRVGLEDWLDTCRSAEVLVFFEGPEVLLAQGPRLPEPVDCAKRLAAWKASARQLVSMAYAAPSRSVFIDATEGAAHFPELIDFLARRFGLGKSSVAERDLPPPAQAPLASLIAAAAVARDVEATQLHYELRVMSTAWRRNGPTAGPRGYLDAIDLEAALDQAGDFQTAAEQYADLQMQVLALFGDLVGPLSTERSAPASLQSTLIDARKSFLALQDSVGQLRHQLSDAQADRNYLTLHLQHTQDELERWMRRADKEESLNVNVGGAKLQIGATTLVSVRDEPPHREVSFRISHAKWGLRRLGAFELRLVEHNGLPGICLLSADQATGPLDGWQPNGQEGASWFMLLVPRDSIARDTLTRMGCQDWSLLNALAKSLEVLVSSAELKQTPRWRIAARRLTSELAELPLTLRHDGITVQLEGEVCTVRLFGCGFAAEVCDELKLQLHLNKDELNVELRRPEDPAQLPFLHAWPMNQDGALEPTMRLSLASSQRTRQHAVELEEADEARVLAILQAVAQWLNSPSSTDTLDAALVARLTSAIGKAAMAIKRVRAVPVRRRLKMWVRALFAA